MCDQQACGHDPARADGIAEGTVLLLDGIYSSAPVGFAFLDPNFRYVRVNERLASIDRCPMADHSGRTVQEVMPGLWSRVEPSFRWVLRSGESLVNLEVRGETIAAHGTVRHWATSIYAVHSQERTIGLGVLVTDTTERRRAEAAALHELLRAPIGALAASVEARVPYTAGHQRRVSQLSTTIATKIGLDTDTVTGIGVAAHIHDMGKIAIPAELLMRPGPLRAGEFELIQGPPPCRREIIAGISFPWPVAETVCEHHERFDGSGIPEGSRETRFRWARGS
jgi:HD-GYP domain-containing protein (c-di-GMP phosphodiesterase class II)